MPHRTVFQWGKDHAHPFTVFLGGVVIGTLVTGTLAWAWVMADNANLEYEEVIIEPPVSTASPSASPGAVTATPSTGNQPQF